MKISKKAALAAITAATFITQFALAPPVLAGADQPPVARWTVQVAQVGAANDVNVEPAFRIAIYENLLQELVKRKQFSAVLRSGDRDADGVPSLLMLKTVVEAYTPGSETKRAITTVAGATKLRVRSQLCTRDGQVVLERFVEGNVRLFGGNLRATHILARNVANAIEQSPLPDPAPSVRKP